MSKEKISITSKILELNDVNDIYMELTMCVLTNQTNLNKLKFTDDYIDGIVNNKERFIGIPLVANRSKLESGLYNNLTHELDRKTGTLNTDQVGSIVDFWVSEEDDVRKLMGSVRVHKRYPNVCNAMIELFESGELNFSCEIYAYGYAEINEETNERSVNYEYDGQVNSLFGSCVVTSPAEPLSKAELLVAEALEKDLKGGEIVPDQTPKTEVFNKGQEIKFHGNIETSALTSNDISNSIYNILNPVDPKTNYRKYNYWISTVYFAKKNDFDGYVVAEDWDDYQTLFRINFKIENDVVSIDIKDNWIEGYKGFIPKGINIDDLIEAKENAEIELNNKIAELNSAHKEDKEVTEEQIKELQAQIDAFTKQVSELNGLVVSQKEEIVQLQSKETELNSSIQELAPYKEKVELAEKEKQQSTLTEKYSKLLSEDTQKTDEYKKAIEELNSQALNEMVVAEVAAKAKQTEQKPSGDVIVSARKDNDLIPQDKKSYWYAPKSE